MISSYSKDSLEKYASALSKIASLSNLFSESSTPFIHYRATEYLYANSFGASNLARSDITIDAKLNNLGIGIKTFTYAGKTKFEKIAEFNKQLPSYRDLSNHDKIIQIATLRNERIDLAGRITDTNDFKYHCVARSPGRLIVFEQEMPKIEINQIKEVQTHGTTLLFNDGKNRYKFSTSKSTLYKEFTVENILFEKPIKIIANPLNLLEPLAIDEQPTKFFELLEPISTETQSIILPLYSYSKNTPHVFPRSGLNQWNADGRPRNFDEVYIPIPTKLQRMLPNFLPGRDTPFSLILPSGKELSVKVTQAGGKALASNPNSSLGKWLLRDILRLKEGELLTYDRLIAAGVDSVEIIKSDSGYYINFKQIGSYERFIKEKTTS